MKHFPKAVVISISSIVACQILLTNTSCMKKELYDPEIVDTIMSQASPVDRVDVTHDWVMTRLSTYRIDANISVNAKEVQILTENPRESGNATVINKTEISDGGHVSLAASYPLLKKKLYAALVDAGGAYTVTEFDVEAIQADFSNPLFVSENLAYKPLPQSYAFGYEEEFPEPGDYDYNDIVLHISQERAGTNVIRLNVQLAAVHSSRQLAAAIRIQDYSYDDIDSVKSESGVTFNDNIPSQILTVMTDNVDQLLLRGRNDEAVINLFADAHWATGDNLTESYGVITRKNYNVSKGSDSKNQLIVPRTVSYLIYFKDSSQLNQFSLDSLDPFMIESYNGSNWEVHLNEHRNAQTLYEYTTQDLKNKHLPWALKVPTGLFRHPLKGVNIGFYIKDKEALFGAYPIRKHAFGEWSSDRTQSTDWYLYPQNNNVF